MAKTVANLSIKLSAGTATLQRDLQRAGGTVQGFGNQVRSLGSSLAGLAARAAALAGIGSIGASFGWGIKLAADAEQAQVAFEVMLGSAEAATKILADLKEFGKTTPFEFAGLRDSAKTLAAFGVQQQDLLPTLRMLGDVAGGSQQKLDQIALVYGQISSAGRLMGQDLLQLINVGFNPLQKMSERTGESMLSLKKKMEAGQISFEMVRQEFINATSAGGMFEGMTARMGQTLSGRWSTLKDSVAELALAMGEKLLPAAGKIVEALSGLVQWLGNLDATFVTNTIRVATFAASFAAVFLVIPKIIAGFRAIVAGLQAIAAGQTIVTALTGPAGWLRLAASAGIAAAGVALVADSFAGITSQSQEATAAVDGVTEGVNRASVAAREASNALGSFGQEFVETIPAVEFADDVARAMDSLKEGPQTLEQLRKAGKAFTDQMATPAEKLESELRKIDALLSNRVITEETANRGREKLRADYEASLESAKQIEAIERRLEAVGSAQRGSGEDLAAINAAQRRLAEMQFAPQKAEVPKVEIPGMEPPVVPVIPGFAEMQARLDAEYSGLTIPAPVMPKPQVGQPFVEDVKPQTRPLQPEAVVSPAPREIESLKTAGERFREMVQKQQDLARKQDVANASLAEIAKNTKDSGVTVKEVDL